MLRILFAAALAFGSLAAASDPALAGRHRHQQSACSQLDAVRGLCLARLARAERPARVHRAFIRVGRHQVAGGVEITHGRASNRIRLASADPAGGLELQPGPAIAAGLGRIGGLVAPLAAKAAEIAGACGSAVVSGVRHSFIAGTRRISLHASGKAVDMAGNPACIYARLAGWAGGYSVDYDRVRHVHISWDPDGGREMGAHFRHGGGSRHARRHHHRLHLAARR